VNKKTGQRFVVFLPFTLRRWVLPSVAVSYRPLLCPTVRCCVLLSAVRFYPPLFDLPTGVVLEMLGWPRGCFLLTVANLRSGRRRLSSSLGVKAETNPLSLVEAIFLVVAAYPALLSSLTVLGVVYFLPLP
jgi:hypothetical protein